MFWKKRHWHKLVAGAHLNTLMWWMLISYIEWVKSMSEQLLLFMVFSSHVSGLTVLSLGCHLQSQGGWPPASEWSMLPTLRNVTCGRKSVTKAERDPESTATIETLQQSEIEKVRTGPLHTRRRKGRRILYCPRMFYTHRKLNLHIEHICNYWAQTHWEGSEHTHLEKGAWDVRGGESTVLLLPHPSFLLPVLPANLGIQTSKPLAQCTVL